MDGREFGGAVADNAGTDGFQADRNRHRRHAPPAAGQGLLVGQFLWLILFIPVLTVTGAFGTYA